MKMLTYIIGKFFNLRPSGLLIRFLHGHFQLYLFDDVIEEGICQFFLSHQIDIVLLSRALFMLSDIHANYNYQMNILANNCKRVLFKVITPFRGTIPYNMCTSLDQFDRLRSQFALKKDMAVFNDVIMKSNNVVDNLAYFKIFKLLEDHQCSITHYNDLFLQIYQIVQKKSDNVRMLLAKIKIRVAKKYEANSQFKEALLSLEEGMEVLQSSLVPPLLLYYQVYRYFGHIHQKLGNTKEAVEALKQSVEMIQAYIGHSDDVVSSAQNTKSQARACNSLMKLQPENAQLWLKKAYSYWQHYEGNKYDSQQYLQTIIQEAIMLSKKDKEKAVELIIGNKFNFKNQQFKKRLQSLKNSLHQ